MFRLKPHAATFALIISLLTTFTQTARAESWSWENLFSFGWSANAVMNCTTNPLVTNTGNAGAGTLRQAVSDACAGSTITFDSSVGGEIPVYGQITIDKNLIMQGPGANGLNLRNRQAYGPYSRIFYVNSGVTATISGLRISGGEVFNSGGGGGIYNAGNLTVTNSIVESNRVYDVNGVGGGILSDNATLNVINTTVNGNSAARGGGILSLGTLNLTNSTVANNVAAQQGGGLYHFGSSATITNTTISGNRTLDGLSALVTSGAGIYGRGGTVTLTNSTIAYNAAVDTASIKGIGGGIYNEGSTVSSRNSIIAANTAEVAPDIAYGLNSQGYNLIGNTGGTDIGGSTVGNIVNQNALLAPLGNNGGLTPTHALLSGSPAINAGNTATSPATDQRGAPRVSAADIGAYEFNSTAPIPTPTPTPTPDCLSLTNPTTIVIPSGAPATTQGPASLYPSSINVAGLLSAVTKVTVSLNNLNHTYPSNMDMLLVGPGGQTVVVMSDTGGANDIVNVDLTFDDAAATRLPDFGQIVSGSFKPTNARGTLDTFPAPAPPPSPATGYGLFLTTFNGTSPNGTWSLYVLDTESGEVGSLVGGWTLNITTAGCVTPPPPTPIPTPTPTPTPTPAPTPIPTPTPCGTDLAAAGSPRSVAVGDVDGDGDLDIATANSDSNNASIRLNDGAGVFSGGSDVAVGISPYSIALGDVDGDLDLDVATANVASDNASIRLNDGTGVFSGGSDVAAGDLAVSVALGDVDGDGDLDIAIANLGFNNVSIRLNDGTGVFSGGSDVPVGISPYSVAFGDLDGDGDLDVATANYSASTVSSRLNDGAGVFSGGSDVPVDGGPFSIALGDVDGDGDLDVASVSVWADNASIRLNDGAGVFSGGSNVPVAGQPVSVAFGDVDGDGDLDLAVASRYSVVSIRYNDGEGTFSGGNDVPGGIVPAWLVFGDLDGDGNLDIATVGPIGLYLRFSYCLTPTQTPSPTPTPTQTPTPTPTPNTPIGSNVTVQSPSGDATATFALVTTAGDATFTPIVPPSSVGTPPTGYTILNDAPSYDITTTAAYTAPVTVCFAVSSINDAVTFARVRILQGENGQLVDRTILAPDAPAPDFATRSVCARVNSLAPFVVALAPNMPPNAAGDAYSLNEDTNLTVPASGVLANDTDGENNSLTAVVQTSPTNAASFELYADGSFSYTPNANFSGTDSFTYTAFDGSLASGAATVTITVNAVDDAPTVSGGLITTSEDTPSASFMLTGSDGDGDDLTFAVLAGPAKGTYNAATGVYTPNANATGGDSFTFKASDGTSDSATATVSINIIAVNDAPTANAQSVTTEEDTSKAIILSGNDLDGDALTYTVVTGPEHGSFTGGIYAPFADYNGPDSFTFRVNDGSLDSGLATASITINPVNDAPTAAGQSVTTDEDTAKPITLSGTDVDGDPLTYMVVTAPAHGSLSCTEAVCNFTPAANYNGPDSFTFRVSDGALNSSTATVSITINPINDAPVLAAIGNKTTDEGAALTFTATGNDNADNPNPNTLSFSLIGAPAGATITAAGAFSWTPTEEQGPGTFTFHVRVTDDGTGSLFSEEQITITVREVNAAPVLGSIGNLSGYWGNTYSFTATATDSDLPANNLIYTLTGAVPTGASITPEGAFSWTPSSMQTGTYTLTVKVTDNGAPSLSGTRMLTIVISPRPTQLTYSGAAAGQYSDSVPMSAKLTDNGGGSLQGTVITDKTVGFTLGSQAASGATDGSSVAGASLKLTQMAQAYSILSQFGGDASYSSSGDSDPFTINKENTATDYTGDFDLMTAGPTITNATVRLAAKLTQEADNSLGDISKATVTFKIYKFSATDPTFVLTGVPVNSNGDAQLSYTLPADQYRIMVEVDGGNGYWTANPVGDGLLNITVPTNEVRSSGGGWLPDATSASGKARFAFSVTGTKSGQPKGNVSFSYKDTDGFTYVVKSNSWQGGYLQFAAEPNVSPVAYTRSNIKGSCNVQKIDPTTGAVVASFGGHSFEIFTRDGGPLNPRQGDSYSIIVRNSTNGIFHQVGSQTSLITLGGGNITNKAR